MNIHFYILFTLTFFTGVAAGAVLYVGAFAPAYQPPPPPPASERSFELRGERFTASCLRDEAGCDRFTLSENRRLERVEAGEEQVSVRVSSQYFQALLTAVQAAALADMQQQAVSCQSFDRVGEQYLLIYQGEVYTLHSCSEAFQDDALASYVSQLWDRDVPTTTAPAAIFEEGITGSLQRYLRNHFNRSGE